MFVLDVSQLRYTCAVLGFSDEKISFYYRVVKFHIVNFQKLWIIEKATINESLCPQLVEEQLKSLGKRNITPH